MPCCSFQCFVASGFTAYAVVLVATISFMFGTPGLPADDITHALRSAPQERTVDPLAYIEPLWPGDAQLHARFRILASQPKHKTKVLYDDTLLSEHPRTDSHCVQVDLAVPPSWLNRSGELGDDAGVDVTLQVRVKPDPFPSATPAHLREADYEVTAEVPLSLYSTPLTSTNDTNNQTLHLRQRVTLNMVRDHVALHRFGVPAELFPLLEIRSLSSTKRRNRHRERVAYRPFTFFHERFWARRSTLAESNGTTDSGASNDTLSICYEPVGLGWLRLSSTFNRSFSMMAAVAGEQNLRSDIDSMKMIITETGPILLAVTLTVSLLHIAFDMLAFKSDIDFWRSRKSVRGLSIRSMLLSAVCRVVILLYLMDNDASWLVMYSSVVSLVIMTWKLFRAFGLMKAPLSRAQLAQKDKPEDPTRKYDREAMQYLYYLLVPLLLGCFAYSVMYRPWRAGRGVYSWALETGASFVYFAGFFFMLPQLYVNYRLKSVAHLPWMRLVYAALNTFVDDFFALIMPMPHMHKWAAFRDDIVFIAFLYQRWLYRDRRGAAAVQPEADGSKEKEE